jgi:hypothetical protein
MKFQIRIPKEVKDKIASWGLSSRCRKQLYRTIQSELETRPDGGFPRLSVAPVRCAILPLVVTDPDTGLDREFTVWVNIWTEMGVRIVLDCAERGRPTGY